MPASVRNSEQNPIILIVDRAGSIRNRLASIFSDAGFHPRHAGDASAVLRSLSEQLCDLIMLNAVEDEGRALCKVIRAQPRTAHIPIIGFSHDNTDTARADALASGADDFLTLASSPGEIVSRANSRLLAAQREWALTGTNRELRFLADLGRGLLRTLEPEQLVRRVAGATYEGTGATVCAAYLNLGSDIEAACVFDREGTAEGVALLHADRVQLWLQSTNASVTAVISDSQQFLIRDDVHTVEYAAALRFGGRTQGVLVVGFDNRDECGDTECRLVDAAAQQASLAAHISSLYQTAKRASVTLAEEVDRRTEEIETHRRFTEAIIDSLPLSLYAVDRDYRILAWNRNRELGELGIPRGAALGKNIFSVLTRQRREILEMEFKRVFQSGEIERIEQESVTDNGETKYWLISKIPMWLDESGQVSHVITVGEEITARVEANRAVARAEKLAAVGRLASGVVHEINNPLATISACAEALESRVAEGAFADSPALGDLQEYLGLIRSEAFRCKSITNGLLDFSRTRAAQHAPIDISEVISSAAHLLTHQKRGERIAIQLNAPPGLPPVLGDRGQLQQAVIALATNAVDAMPFGGTLMISARSDDDKVLIDVADSGIGIPTGNLPKIFDPFFTTKEVGRGTGLGLAVCYGILTEHGGRLDVQSTVGIGSTFTISLPAANHNGDSTG